MNPRNYLFFLIIIGAVLIHSEPRSWGGEETSSIRTFEFPTDLYSFQPSEGQEIAQSYCLICHSADYIYMQPAHSEEKWTAIVHKMKRVFGCPIPNDHIPTLVGYLVIQNDVDPWGLLTKEVQKDNLSLNRSMGNSNQGKEVYTTYCLNCHDTTGKGDGPIGQSLVPPAADLTIIGEKSDKALLQIIRNGRPGTAMPSWKGDLSDQDILDVLSYI